MTDDYGFGRGEGVVTVVQRVPPHTVVVDDEAHARGARVVGVMIAEGATAEVIDRIMAPEPDPEPVTKPARRSRKRG